jgi:anti-sigma B factor antagonist
MCNISPNVLEVFKITKLNKVFAIYDNEEKALKAFKGGGGWFG